MWLSSAAAFAQQNAAQKKPITHDVYDSWKSIQSTEHGTPMEMHPHENHR